MIIDHKREKLLQSVVFFAHNVKKLGKTKLFKLLYFLDFEHYRDTARSVTGMEYFAWKMGPVPKALHEELDDPHADWRPCIEFKEVTVRSNGGTMLLVKAICDFNEELFSRRELKIMRDLAARYADSNAESMVEVTHLENLPWHKVWEKEGQKQASIPYDYALRRQDFDAMKSIASERDQFVKALKI